MSNLADRLVSSRLRTDGARLPMTQPPRVVVTATPSRSPQVLQSRRAPAQLSLFPPPGRTR